MLPPLSEAASVQSLDNCAVESLINFQTFGVRSVTVMLWSFALMPRSPAIYQVQFDILPFISGPEFELVFHLKMSETHYIKTLASTERLYVATAVASFISETILFEYLAQICSLQIAALFRRKIFIFNPKYSGWFFFK